MYQLTDSIDSHTHTATVVFDIRLNPRHPETCSALLQKQPLSGSFLEVLHSSTFLFKIPQSFHFSFLSPSLSLRFESSSSFPDSVLETASHLVIQYCAPSTVTPSVICRSHPPKHFLHSRSADTSVLHTNQGMNKFILISLTEECASSFHQASFCAPTVFCKVFLLDPIHRR